MDSDRIAKKVYVGECAGSRSVSRPRERCIDAVKGKEVWISGRMVQDRCECLGECMGPSPGGMNP